MPRVTPVFAPADYPGSPDHETAQSLIALFSELFPQQEEPRIDETHTGLAIAAHSPKFALNLSRLTTDVALELGWSERPDLMELAIQAVNTHFNCSFSFETRLPRAEATGIGLERIAALPLWRTSRLFDDEQRLVLEFTHAAVTGTVPDELFVRIKDRYGEKGVVELTALIATFSLWAIMIGVTCP